MSDLEVAVGKIIQQYGWYAVAITVIVYVARRPSLWPESWQRARHRWALRAAQEPERVRILDVEQQRVREQQQQHHAREVANAPPKRKRPRPRPPPQPRGPPSRGDGGLRGYRPPSILSRYGRRPGG